jgi:hypothetical protein
MTLYKGGTVTGRLAPCFRALEFRVPGAASNQQENP